MKKLVKVQSGFIPMIIMILLIVIGMIVLAYMRVSGVNK
jgi:Tfp pilus assembly protein PilX